MYARCVLLCRLAHELGLTYILEQPLSSVMNYAPRFQQLMRETVVWMASPVHMGSYGGDSQKSLKLFSNRQWVGQLVTKLPAGFTAVGAQTTRAYQDASGTPRVTGGPGLKASQAYPRRFGDAVAKVYSRNSPSRPGASAAESQRPTMKEAQKIIRELRETDSDRWSDAGMDEVLTYLKT